MTYDLRTERWIPWRRRSGTVEWGPPWLLTDGIAGDDPIVALAAPRPDFDGALQEFLIGLLGVAMQVADEEAWEALWRSPPTPETLRAALDRLPQAFDLDGDGPRFFQDFPAADLAAEAPGPIDQLLIDAVGDQTIKLNKDLFVKRGRVERLGRPAAAMALLAMQTYAPAGGRGNRTSLRGGGPLTTLVDPRVDTGGELLAHERPLWEKLWANVETLQQAAGRSPTANANSPADVFPWLAPTRSSAAANAAVTPASVSPWQAYFGLPRRIRLEFGAAGRCDLTGRNDAATVATFRSRPYGVQYAAWEHPLTPHYESPKKDWLPVHGQPGGIGWRDWLGLTFGTPDEKRRPARTVAAFTGRAGRVDLREARLHAFGYDMDNAKARGWTDASQPVFAAPDAEHRQLIGDAAGRLTEGTSLAASLLFGGVQRALFQRPEDAPGDLSVVKAELWASTEAPFFQAMRAIAAPGASITAADEICQRFARTLTHQALAIFDRWCPGDALEPVALRRVVTARYNLARALGGWTPLGEKLFATLRIPLPGGGRAARLAKSAKSRTRKEAKK
ncbi:MAG TPA: type I-E CRISPR-associated protein Cse1/CasA [Gemmatimonadaceae bacterium]|nr:type I-E CRISPR-associated protein Cse1/CasA [Gemmatimonadaceae bacterium]